MQYRTGKSQPSQIRLPLRDTSAANRAVLSMPAALPIALGEKKAAATLDMRPSEFRALVNDGILPKPRKIGPLERWDAEELRALLRGGQTDGYEDVRW